MKKDNDVGKMYYVYSDHLGSILTLTDDQGTIVFEQNFDAWGRKRNPSDWTYTNIPFPSGDMEWLYRGYTGHEHLPEFSLINMNGRMYDPVVGVMLSPDNYVQEISSTKNFNRYSYCVNNPLNSTDPSGDFIFTLLAAVFCPPLIPLGVAMDVGGVANTVAHIEKIDKPGDFFAAYGIGAAAGAAAYYTGGAAFTWAGGTALGGGGFMAGGIAAGTGAVSSTAILSTGNGVYFQDPINPGDIAITLATSIVLGGTLQGLNAISYDRNFWNGSFPEVTSIPSISISSVPINSQEGQLRNTTLKTDQLTSQPNLNINKQNDGINIKFEKSTWGKSTPNHNVGISAKEMTNNLLNSGGQYVPIDINKYAVDFNNLRYVFYFRNSTGNAGVEIFNNGISIQKYSLLNW